MKNGCHELLMALPAYKVHMYQSECLYIHGKLNGQHEIGSNERQQMVSNNKFIPV